jgi:hypothetical protein
LYNFILGEPINHATAYGRIAFSVPTTDLKNFQEKAQNNQYKILTPFVTLDTPGKASVSVVIFADPVRFLTLILFKYFHFLTEVKQ